MAEDEGENADAAGEPTPAYKDSKLILLWVPILVAVIGLIGSISQPVLHFMGVIYQGDSPENDAELIETLDLYTIDVSAYGYDRDDNKALFYLRPLRLVPDSTVTGQQLRASNYIVGMRIENDAIPPDEAIYEHYRGPVSLQLAARLEFANFTELITEDLADRCLQFSIFLADGIDEIVGNFDPGAFGDSVRFVRDFHECYDSNGN